MNDIAISVKNLTKVYPLYDKPIDRLKEALNPFKKSYHHDFYALSDVSFDIKKGETFTSENLRAIRPGAGLPPKYLDNILGLKASRDIPRGTPLSWKLVGR